MKLSKIGLKKKDLMLMGIILFIAAVCSLVHHFTGEAGKGMITIKVDGVTEDTYSLTEDRKIEINHGTNILEIKDGEASMIEADCPDQICVHQKAISANGESIICLPNKVVVEVESDKESELDAVMK